MLHSVRHLMNNFWRRLHVNRGNNAEIKKRFENWETSPFLPFVVYDKGTFESFDLAKPRSEDFIVSTKNTDGATSPRSNERLDRVEDKVEGVLIFALLLLCHLIPISAALLFMHDDGDSKDIAFLYLPSFRFIPRLLWLICSPMWWSIFSTFP